MEQIIFSQLSLEEFKAAIADVVVEKIKPFLSSMISDQKGNEIYLSRIEVSKQLKISLPTLHNLTLLGCITGYRIGRRVLYKPNEVEAALQQIATNKYKRKDLL